MKNFMETVATLGAALPLGKATKDEATAFEIGAGFAMQFIDALHGPNGPTK